MVRQAGKGLLRPRQPFRRPVDFGSTDYQRRLYALTLYRALHKIEHRVCGAGSTSLKISKQCFGDATVVISKTKPKAFPEARHVCDKADMHEQGKINNPSNPTSCRTQKAGKKIIPQQKWPGKKNSPGRLRISASGIGDPVILRIVISQSDSPPPTPPAAPVPRNIEHRICGSGSTSVKFPKQCFGDDFLWAPNSARGRCHPGPSQC